MKAALPILCFFLLLSTASVSQNRVTENSATCIAFWKKYDSLVYNITHTKTKTDSKGQVTSRTSNYEAHIKVVDSVESGFTLEWIYKNFRATGATEQALNSLETIMEGLKFIYKTDDVGMFSELLNWQQVRDFAFANYEKAIAQKGQSSEFVVALKQVKSIFGSKENIEALLIKEVQLFHQPFGKEYNKKAEIFETELPNVTGGAPFPANITIALNESDVKNDLIKISINQTIDKGKAGPIIAEMLKKLLGSSIKNEAEMKKQVRDMETSDINQYTVSLSSGWIRNMIFKRTSNIGSIKQVEDYQFTRSK